MIKDIYHNIILFDFLVITEGDNLKLGLSGKYSIELTINPINIKRITHINSNIKVCESW